MGRRREKDNQIRSLTKVARRSLGLTLPVELVNKLGWRAKQKVRVNYSRGRLVISDWKQKKKIAPKP